MSMPDYPITLAKDRHGTWLHVTGLSLREVVQVLPERFARSALLVFEPQQLNYATSALIEEKRAQGIPQDQVFADIVYLDDNAFWNRMEPLFENPSCAAWPADTLDEMIVVQGPQGGAFGVCAIPPEFVSGLPDDFAYEHPSNVGASLAFLSMDDAATSIYATDDGDVVRIVEFVVRKALGLQAGDTEGLGDVARALMPLIEDGGVDLRREPAPGKTHPSVSVVVGLWNLRSHWPLLWRRVALADVHWNGRAWALTDVRHVPGRSFIQPVRLTGELFQWTTRGVTFLIVFGLPIAMAILTWAASGWIFGLLALLIAVVLWPRFVLGLKWREIRERKAREAERQRKHGLP
jgi:hypothetical protein